MNLTTTQRKALAHLRRTKYISIKATDKGSGQYTYEALRQLSDTKHYKLLSENAMPNIQNRIHRVIDKHVATGAIPQATANLLPVTKPTPAEVYLLPKVHKNIEVPPGKPTMAGNGHPTERISQYVDEHLKQHMKSIPSYIKDTNHFLDIFRNTALPPNSRIVTLGV